jgi:hypothetical protein
MPRKRGKNSEAKNLGNRRHEYLLRLCFNYLKDRQPRTVEELRRRAAERFGRKQQGEVGIEG